jgi:protein phosphatase
VIDQVHIASAQIIGSRSNQEDAFLIRRFLIPEGDGERVVCAVLADGMGGHVAGERASRIVVNSFYDEFERNPSAQPERLKECLDTANLALAEDLKRFPEWEGMGSTLLAVVISEGRCSFVSVGDSPLLLAREEEIRQLNADHSMAPLLDQMVTDGNLTRQAALLDPRRNNLRSAVTGQDVSMVDVGGPFEMQPADRLLLASDGVETLNWEQIGVVIMRYDVPETEQTIQCLMEEIKQRNAPNQDNATAILIATE